MTLKTYLKNFFWKPEDKTAQLETKIYYHRRAVAEAQIESMVPGLKVGTDMTKALELIAERLEELTKEKDSNTQSKRIAFTFYEKDVEVLEAVTRNGNFSSMGTAVRCALRELLKTQENKGVSKCR